MTGSFDMAASLDPFRWLIAPRWSSGHDLTACDVEGDAGDPRRRVGGEEEHGVGDVLCCAESPRGCIAVIWALRSAGIIVWSRSVKIVDGATQLTRTPWGATSFATSWVSRTTPALATA
jgi:hypothetical protein